MENEKNMKPEEFNIPDLDLSQILSAARNSDVNLFRYFPKRRMLVTTHRLCNAIGCKHIYTDMPRSFGEEFVASVDMPLYEKLFRNAEEGKTSMYTQLNLKSPELYCRMSMTAAQYDENGEIELYIGALKILSDEDFSRQDVMLKTMQTQMLEFLGCGVVAYTLPDRRILMVNNEAKRYFNYDSSSGKTLIEAMSENFIPADFDAMRKISATLKNVGDSCKYVIHSRQGTHGKRTTLDCSSKLLAFENGERYILSVIQDVTEQVEIGNMLRIERRQFRDTVLSNTEYSYRFDVTEGLLTSDFIYSGRGQSLKESLNITHFPIKHDDMVARWIAEKQPEYLSPNEYNNMTTADMLNCYKRGIKSIESEFYLPSTEKYYRKTTLLSENEEDGHIMAIVYAIDITDSVRAETRQRNELSKAKQALQEAYDAANAANIAKTEFLSRMSHDIRTPMNAIIGMTAIAATHIDEKERVADCLSKITVSGKHLLGLINDVLDMSKIESGNLSLDPEPFNFSDLIEELLSISKGLIESKNHSLSVNASGVEHENVIGDSHRIQQVFVNLMSNAVKYTPDGGKISLTVREKPTNRPKIGCYEFVFEDNGIGMSEEFLENIFEPFSRSNDTRIKTVQGTGLGMPITKNIVNMMNGEIKVESKLNVGTKVTVSLFLELQTVEYDIALEELVDLPILVVDDDPDSCETACELLNELGMNGEFVLRGREAVEKVKEHHAANNDYFAVIVDWRMPEMDGVETTKAIRAAVGDEVPIVIISAYDWSDIENEARDAGANAFISKPLFKSKVVHLFKRLVSDEVEETGLVDLSGLRDHGFKNKRVLLVEDNELNSEIACELLTMAGFEVEHVVNGKEAVDKLIEVEDGYYDLIFMDIQMPIMNGYDATVAIRAMDREYTKRVPIIAMTANAFAEDVRASKNAGMNEHIAKPIDHEKLFDVMKKWLGDSDK